MRVISLNVGLPQEIQWRGRTVLTSIFKTPVDRRLRVSTLNFEGDQQSDLTVHGGVDKAVYAYPFEHYEYWRNELPEADLPLGAFGENLTTEGLLESEMRIGSRFRIGSAEFVVTQPRCPATSSASASAVPTSSSDSSRVAAPASTSPSRATEKSARAMPSSSSPRPMRA